MPRPKKKKRTERPEELWLEELGHCYSIKIIMKACFVFVFSRTKPRVELSGGVPRLIWTPIVIPRYSDNIEFIRWDRVESIVWRERNAP